MKYVLGMALGLAGVMLPSAVRADDIVAATVSNLTFNGNSVCGPSGTSLCSEVFNASFLWDNTTSTEVAGSLQFSSAGPLGTFGAIVGPFLDPSGPDMTLSADDSFHDLFGFTFDLSSQTLTPGTYPLQVIFAPRGRDFQFYLRGESLHKRLLPLRGIYSAGCGRRVVCYRNCIDCIGGAGAPVGSTARHRLSRLDGDGPVQEASRVAAI